MNLTYETTEIDLKITRTQNQISLQNYQHFRIQALNISYKVTTFFDFY